MEAQGAGLHLRTHTDQQTARSVGIRIATVNQNICKIRDVADFQHPAMGWTKARGIAGVETAVGADTQRVDASRDAGLARDLPAGRLPLVFEAKANRSPDADHPDSGLSVGKQAIDYNVHACDIAQVKRDYQGGVAPLKMGGVAV